MPEDDERKWRRVMLWLAHGIRSGRWPVGSTLPTPADLVPEVYRELQLSVDRNTVRRAVRALGDVGVLSTRSGAGTFVSAIPPEVIPDAPHVSPIERRLNARIDEIEQRLRRIEKDHPRE